MEALAPDSVIMVGLLGMVVIAFSTLRMSIAEAGGRRRSRLRLRPRHGAGGTLDRTADPTHLLEEWFAGFPELEAPAVRHHRTFREPPERVFAALVQVVAAEGHIVAIEGFGSVVVFEAECGGPDLTRTLVGRVSGAVSGSALAITSVTSTPCLPDERRRECLEANRLLAEVTRRLHVPSRLGTAAAFMVPPAGFEPAT